MVINTYYRHRVQIENYKNKILILQSSDYNLLMKLKKNILLLYYIGTIE